MRNAVVVLLAGAGMAVPAAPTGLYWSGCPGGAGVDARQECAVVTVPIDHARPDGPQLGLAVSRIRTAVPEKRRGVLVLVPGGPGSPGLNRPSAVVARLPAEVRERFDLVSYDPRGVGASAPVSCGLAPSDITPIRMMPWPGAGGDIAPTVAWARRAAGACRDNGGPVFESISTRTAEQDLDAVRRALGERRISFWGVSYGTYVGAAYTTMFPGRTDRAVLDSNDDPDPALVARGWAAGYAIGAEDRFPDFARWVVAQDRAATTAGGGLVESGGTVSGGPSGGGGAGQGMRYGLGEDVARVRATYLGLAARLDREPLPWSGAVPPVLDGNALRSAMLGGLYADANFPRVAALMRAALDGGPLPPTSAPPEAALQNTLAVLTATICHDVSWPRDVGRYAADVAADRAAHPLTAGMPVNIYTCAFLPRPETPAIRIKPAEVLMVQNLRDPATPYAKALNLRRALGARTRMVTVDAGGHGAYLANGNDCGDAWVTAYLSAGTRPAHDVRCGKG